MTGARPQQRVEESLARISDCDGQVRAWVRVDAVGARRAARELDDRPTGLLHGLPVGVKDIVDVAGLPTECGSPLRHGRLAERDASLVSRLRAAGAVPMGKTVTTEFAYFTPGPTRNPAAPGHTPGGSSSGSAAAVAAGMVPLAVGSQTAGSLTRPASYCGVAGYVAPVGLFDTTGFTGLAPSLDAPGFLAGSVAVLAVVHRALTGEPDAVPGSGRRARVAVWTGAELDTVAPAMHAALSRTSRHLETAGVDVVPFPLADQTPRWADLHAVVMAHEAARSLAIDSEQRDRISDPLRELIDRGAAISDAEHRDALTAVAAARDAVLQLLDHHDAVLGPAAPGPAPSGLGSTGSPVMSRPWQLLGLPVVTVPGHRDEAGLPLGVQLIGHPDRVGALFALAELVEQGATGPHDPEGPR